MFIGPCIIAIDDEWKTNLMSLAILFHFLCAQHVSDINISIFRSLCVGAFGAAGFGWCSFCRLQPAKRTSLKTNHTKAPKHKLLKMDILMSKTCWAHNKWRKIASDIKLVFHSSTIAMTHGPINIRFRTYIELNWLHSFQWFLLAVQVKYF